MSSPKRMTEFNLAPAVPLDTRAAPSHSAMKPVTFNNTVFHGGHPHEHRPNAARRSHPR
jgi:hypothetical protein